MSRLLFPIRPVPGHAHPNMAIAHALRVRAHEGALYTGSSVRSLIGGERFCHFPFQLVDEVRAKQILESIVLKRNRPFQLKALWRSWVLETVPLQLTDLEDILAVWPPDVIVCDPSMWAPFLILHETRGIPVAVFQYMAACILSGRDAPVLGFPLPRPRIWFQQLRARLIRSAIGFFLADVRRAASALRQTYGLSPLRTSVADFAGQMPLYLVPSSPEFDYERSDLPPSVHYVGPCFWSKPRNQPPPAWLEQLPRDRSLVYVTEGTVHVQPRVLRAAAQGLADRPMHVVMTTGTHRDPAELDLGPLAPNIRVERWVPLSDLLPHTDAVVTTGGPNTVLATLQAGVPLVVVPFDWDHPENAWRVVEAGAGLRLAPRHCTPKHLREAVERVLNEPLFRENAQRLAATFARYRGPVQAAELLERLSTCRLSPASTT